MNGKKIEKEQVLQSFNWSKAENKILKRTATREDEAPVKLNNESKPKTKQVLLKPVEETFHLHSTMWKWKYIEAVTDVKKVSPPQGVAPSRSM